MNNKGVTLIELLIVIVVIGIISAFAVPAVSSFLDNAKTQAVYQDAVAVRNAAAYYCAAPANTCAADETLTYADVKTYLDSFDASKYVTDGPTPDDELGVVATLSSGSWLISLEAEGTNSGNYEWISTTVDPANGSSSDVVVDDND